MFKPTFVNLVGRIEDHKLGSWFCSSPATRLREHSTVSLSTGFPFLKWAGDLQRLSHRILATKPVSVFQTALAMVPNTWQID